MDDKRYLLSMIREGEHQQQDFKYRVADACNDDIRRLLDVIQSPMTLNQIVRMSRLPRPKVITLMARLIRFGTLRWEYTNQQFLFSQL